VKNKYIKVYVIRWTTPVSKRGSPRRQNTSGQQSYKGR